MVLHEPATLLTDYLLAALAGGLARRLQKHTSPANRAARWWSRALALTAASAFIGGSYHGFASDLSTSVANAWWISTLLVIGLLSAAMEMSLIHELADADRPGSWRGLVALKLGVFAAAVLVHPQFVVAIIDYGLTMLAWAAAATIVRRTWWGWMLAAIGLSFLASVVQQMSWSVSTHFNHNDLYHVIQAVAIVGFYRAGCRFGTLAR